MYLDKVMAIDVLSMGQISTTSGKKQYILSMLVSHLFHQTHSLSKLPQFTLNCFLGIECLSRRAISKIIHVWSNPTQSLATTYVKLTWLNVGFDDQQNIEQTSLNAMAIRAKMQKNRRGKVLNLLCFISICQILRIISKRSEILNPIRRQCSAAYIMIYADVISSSYSVKPGRIAILTY